MTSTTSAASVAAGILSSCRGMAALGDREQSMVGHKEKIRKQRRCRSKIARTSRCKNRNKG